MTANGWLQIVVFLLAVFAVTPLLGGFMARVFSRQKTWLDPVVRPLERLIYKLTGVDETREMRWTEYAVAVLMFSVVSMLVLYVMQRLQHVLPLNPQGFGPVAPDLAFNTAVSFTTNTNWQAYGGETTMSYFTQMAGLAYHNFVSAAVGISVAIAFIRGIAQREKDTLGNFWVDMVRATLWVLLPISIVGALFLVSQGVVQNLKPYDKVAVIDPQTVSSTGADGKPQTTVVSEQTIAQGPVASQEIIKQFGTNGGGFFNANSSHPFENPDAAVELPRDVRDLRDLGRPHLHARLDDRIAPARLGGLGRDGVSLRRRRHGGVLGRSPRQPDVDRRRRRSGRRPISPPAGTWRARKCDSASPIPPSSPPPPPTPVAAPSTAGTTRSRRSAAWCRSPTCS